MKSNVSEINAMTDKCTFCDGTKVEPGQPGCVWCDNTGKHKGIDYDRKPADPELEAFKAYMASTPMATYWSTWQARAALSGGKP